MPQGTCSVDGCPKAAHARGWCGAHYQRWYKTGDPTDAPSIERPACSVADCEKPSKTRGWCQMHYMRWLRKGDDGLLVGRRKPPRPCSEDGCDKHALARGFCGTHYAQWKKKFGPPCTVDGCETPLVTRGMCEKHYHRWLHWGDPLKVRGDSDRSLDKRQGYWMVKVPGHPTAGVSGWAMEHRYVAWEAGILTDLSMDVHHKNHVRDDNRPENLEVIDHAEHARHHSAVRRALRDQGAA